MFCCSRRPGFVYLFQERFVSRTRRRKNRCCFLQPEEQPEEQPGVVQPGEEPEEEPGVVQEKKATLLVVSC